MWRAMILATGVSLVILGGECLVVDKVILAESSSKIRYDDGISYGDTLTPRRVFVPPEWSPWALLASGAAIVLYSYSRSGTED